MSMTRVAAGVDASIDDLNQLIDLLQGTSGFTEAFLLRCAASSDFKIRLADAAGAQRFEIQDSAGVAQAYVDSDGNLTILGSFSPAGLVLPQSTSPSQTAEGSIFWDTDDDVPRVGTGSATKAIGLTRGAGSNATATAEMVYDTTAAAFKVWDGSASQSIGKAVKLVASSDTPATTTATSVADILTISSLSIPVTSRVVIDIMFSKDANVADAVYLALTVNATAVKTQFAVSSATQQIENGTLRFDIAPRTTETSASTLISYFSRTATGGAAKASDITVALSSAMPVATITSLTFRGSNSTSNNNLTVEAYRVWEYPV